MKEGLFIVIYGINNIGKSTQVEMLLEAFKKAKLEVKHIKYPIYDLEPTGSKINEVLRSGKEQVMSEVALQKLYAKNRLDYQSELIRMLASGINIIAEDYVGTGLGWGWTKGAEIEELIKINRGLLKPDIVVLLDGERYLEGKEENHIHETNDEWMETCRDKYMELATRFNWEVVDANQTRDEVHDNIIDVIEKKVKELE